MKEVTLKEKSSQRFLRKLGFALPTVSLLMLGIAIFKIENTSLIIIIVASVILFFLPVAVILFKFLKIYKSKHVKLSIDEGILSVDGNNYNIAEIEGVNFSGKWKTAYSTLKQEGCRLRIRDKEGIIVFDDHYANIDLFKQVLAKYFADERPEKKVVAGVQKSFSFKLFHSFVGILTVLGVVFFVFILALNDFNGFLIAFPLIVGWIYLILWRYSNLKFTGKGDLNIVPVLPLMEVKTLRIEDIKEAVFEKRFRGDEFLRIILHDYSFCLVRLDHFSREEVNSIISEFKQRGMLVRDDL